MLHQLRARLQHLDDLIPSDLDALEQAFQAPRNFAARRRLSDGGADDEHIHLVLTGWACRLRSLDDGRRQIVALHLPGDIINLDAVMLQGSSVCTETITACTLATATQAALRELVSRRPSLGTAFWRLTCLQNTLAIEQMLNLGRRSAVQRLAHLLCELHARLQALGEADATSMSLPLVQPDLADVLGLSVVHVNRSMQTLRREGLIEQRGRRLVFSSLARLADYAQFDEAYLHLPTPSKSYHYMLQSSSTL